MMRIAIVLALGTLVTPALPAQIRTVVRTDVPYRVIANRVWNTLGPGVDLSAGGRLFVGDAARTWAEAVVTVNGADVTFTGTAHVEASSSSSATVDAALIVQLSAPAPIAGTLLVETRSGGPTTGIDVGNDGSVELRSVFSTRTAQVGIVLTPEPVEVRCATVGAWIGGRSGGYTVAGTTRVRFQPIPLTLTTTLAPCGATLAARHFQEPGQAWLTFDASTLPSASAVLVVGVQPIRVPIPPSGCVLGTAFLVAVPLPTDSAGHGRFEVGIGVPGLAFQAQAGVLGSRGWQLSNRVDVALP